MILIFKQTENLALEQCLNLINKTATLLWQEYYGLGRFLNKPISGGFAAMENKHKIKWRKVPELYANRDRKMFTRYKRAMIAMTKLSSGREMVSFLEEMDAIYADNNKISPFCVLLEKKVKEMKTTNST